MGTLRRAVLPFVRANTLERILVVMGLIEISEFVRFARLGPSSLLKASANLLSSVACVTYCWTGIGNSFSEGVNPQPRINVNVKLRIEGIQRIIKLHR